MTSYTHNRIKRQYTEMRIKSSYAIFRIRFLPLRHQSDEYHMIACRGIVHARTLLGVCEVIGRALEIGAASLPLLHSHLSESPVPNQAQIARDHENDSGRGLSTRLQREIA